MSCERLMAASLLVASLSLCGAPAVAKDDQPGWLSRVYHQALLAPLPRNRSRTVRPPATSTGTFPATQSESDASGTLGVINEAGPTNEAQNAFFQSLGANGRTCATCHDPASAMGVSVSEIQSRFAANAADPIFAPVDGAICPDTTQPSPAEFFLLLNRGLIRVFLPWPPVGANGATIAPQFTIRVVSDPTGCENDATFGLLAPQPMVSVYRRPKMTANLGFVNFVATPVDPQTGLTQPTNPFTGEAESGNIMWDGREPTLESLANDATLIHAQATTAPTAAQVQQMVAFENGVFAAQSASNIGGSLTANGGLGGPIGVENQPPGVLGGPVIPGGSEIAFTNYAAWTTAPALQALEQSILRGEVIFNTRTFSISNVAGFNDLLGNPFTGTCSTCHSQVGGGSDIIPNAQHDTGVAGNSAAAYLTPDLPQFQLTCIGGTTTPFRGSVVLTSDLGKALITGKCADIGKFTTPQLRGLAARAPYFHNGSAATIADVIQFYVERFGIAFSNQDVMDLENFLLSL
jgi:hypothetical protein